MLCFLIVLLLGYGCCSEAFLYLRACGLNPGFSDLLICLFTSERGVPFIWCVSPAILMLWLNQAGSTRASASWIIRHKNISEVWIEDVSDAVVGAVLFTFFSMFSACSSAMALSGGAISDYGPNGVFAAFTNQALMDPPSEFEVLVICSILAFLVLAVYGTAFQLGRLFFKSPFVVYAFLVLLGLPVVHGPQSFLLNFSGLFKFAFVDGAISNPLSIPFLITTVNYDSWAPGGNHGLVFQAAAFVILLLVGYVLIKRKDYLRV